MKKIYPHAIVALVAVFLFSMTLSAQQTTVTVKVEKDGKMVKDTTYQFEDAEQAKHALKVMEIMSSDQEHMMNYHEDGGHKKMVKVMISEDEEGEWQVIEEELEDVDEEIEIKKIIEEEGDGENVKVVVVKKKVEKDKSKKQ